LNSFLYSNKGIKEDKPTNKMKNGGPSLNIIIPIGDVAQANAEDVNAIFQAHFIPSFIPLYDSISIIPISIKKNPPTTNQRINSFYITIDTWFFTSSC
jgi:hypothetical protein